MEIAVRVYMKQASPMIKGLFDNTIFIEMCFLGKIIATLIGFFFTFQMKDLLSIFLSIFFLFLFPFLCLSLSLNILFYKTK